MRLPKLTFSKAIFITVSINFALFNYTKKYEFFNVTNNSFNNTVESSDIFSKTKSAKFKNNFLKKARENLISQILEQKNFISNLSIFTIKTTTSTIYTDENHYSKKSYYAQDENHLIKYVINTPTLKSGDIKIYSAPVKIKIIKQLDSSKSDNMVFEATLNDSTAIHLSYKDLLYFTTVRLLHILKLNSQQDFTYAHTNLMPKIDQSLINKSHW